MRELPTVVRSKMAKVQRAHVLIVDCATGVTRAPELPLVTIFLSQWIVKVDKRIYLKLLLLLLGRGCILRLATVLVLIVNHHCLESFVLLLQFDYFVTHFVNGALLFHHEYLLKETDLSL